MMATLNRPTRPLVLLLLVAWLGWSLVLCAESPTGTVNNGHDLKSFFLGQQKSPFSERRCLLCRFSVSLINYALKTKRGYDQIDRISNTFCTAAHLESAQVCAQVSKLFNHEITKVLTFGVLTPDQVCGLLSNNTCGQFHSPLDDWEVNLKASLHLDQNELKRSGDKKPMLDITDTAPYRVIHISDTHVDTNYKPGAPVRCQEPLCCQSSSTPLNVSLPGSDERAGYWGSYGQCDVPLWTFEATLKVVDALIREAKDIEYIIWTGDIQPHNVWAQSKRTAVQLYDTVFARIFKYLPKVKILPTLGNHEMVPVDSFSPSNLLDIARDDSPVWLYKKLDAFWSRWLPKDTVNTITRDGFYAATVRRGLKVVSLNTNFCHSKNFWLFINSTDPGSQLQWLVHELQLSELTDEKVHIIGHIPPGSDDCMKVWSKNYNRILRRFKRTITGQFFGHTHYNEFEMFYEEEKVSGPAKVGKNESEATTQPRPIVTSLAMLNTSSMANATANVSDSSLIAAVSTAVSSITLTPIGVGFIGPSVTTFINLNPSFRIYTIEPERGFMPTDFETYFMNLTTANMNSTLEPEWTSAGMFSKTFDLNDTSPESMHELLSDLASEFESDEAQDEAEQEDESDESEADSVKEASSSEGPPSSSTISSGALNATADEEEEDLDADDRLFEMYWLYNSYSDAFDKSTYDRITVQEKRDFLCRLFTGESHNPLACDRFLPKLELYKLAQSADVIEAR